MSIRPKYSLVTASASPVSYDELAEHLRVDSDEDELYLLDLIAAAREYVENITGKCTLSATYRLTSPTWDDIKAVSGDGYFIQLEKTPLISVSSVKYITEDASSLTTVSSGSYSVITAYQPGGVVFASAYDFPDLNTTRPDAVQIEFIAGHADASDVSPSLRHAIKLLAANWYENRLPVAPVNLMPIPQTLHALLNHHRERGHVG